MTPARQITYDFMELPYIMQAEIGVIMGVTRGEESLITFHVNIFTKAKEEGRIPELVELIDRAKKSR
jgi:hypothetical protein